MEQDAIENHLELNEREQEEAEERSSVNVRVVHEAVRREGEEELERSSQALAMVRPGGRAVHGLLVYRRRAAAQSHSRMPRGGR